MKFSTINGIRSIPLAYMVNATPHNPTQANAAKIEVLTMDGLQDKTNHITVTSFGLFFKDDGK